MTDQENSRDDATPNVHPGPRDEGGEGGMATRELAAKDDED